MKLKKGFGLFEIIVSIVLIGMISNILLNTTKLNKSNSISKYNLDKQIELENETSESRKVCAKLKLSPCNELPSGVESGGTCNFSYEYENTLGEFSTVNGTCEVLSSVSFRTNISISYIDKSDYENNTCPGGICTIQKSSKGLVYVSEEK